MTKKDLLKLTNKIIAIDFDGTLVESKATLNKDQTEFEKLEIIEIKEDMIDLTKQLKANGNSIILWTCRFGKYLDEAIELTSKLGIEWDAINDNISIVNGNNSRKIWAHYYIDNASVWLTL